MAKAFAVEILEALNMEALRFVDLKKYCPNDRTRTLRLKELKKLGFVVATAKEVKNHSFIHYQITEKGKKALELIIKIENL